jgi:16S rRNA (cytidine1402-2'-O)-methyltransferase
VWHGPLGEAGPWLEGIEPRGEWVLVLGPRPIDPEPAPGRDTIDAALRAHLEAGLDRRSAVAAVAAELGVPKRDVYATAVELKKGG